MTFKARNLLPYFYLALPFFGFSVFAVGSRGFRIDWMIAFIFIFFMVIQLLLGKLKTIKIDSVIVSLVGLIFFVSLSIRSPLLSGNPQYIRNFITTYLQFLLGALLFFFAYQLRFTVEDLKLLFKVFLIIQALVAAFAVMQLILSYFGYSVRLPFTNPGRALQHSGYEEVTGSVLRSMGTFSEPRQLGAFLLTGLCLSLFFWYEKVRLFRSKQLLPFSISIIVTGVLCTLSTSAVLNMVAFILFFFMYKLILKRDFLKKRTLARIFTLFCVLIIAVSFIYISPMKKNIVTRIKLPDIGKIFYYFTEVPEKAHRWGGFIRGQRLGIEAFANSPVFGVGLNNYSSFVKTNYEELIGPKGCHGPINYLAQTGTLGIIGFGIFLCLLIVKLKKKKRSMANEQKDFLDLGFLIIIVSLFASFNSGLYSLISMFFWANLVIVALILNSSVKNDQR